MTELKEGMLVKSLAGHDKGRIYVISRGDGEYVYLLDGDRRILGQEKKKNRRHVQLIKVMCPLPLSDEKIKETIKKYQHGQ